MLNRIAERLDVVTILDACGVDHQGRHRIACPIHSGEGLNFAILDNGRSWKCFSRGCGGNHKRDAINLWCLLRHGNPLPLLANKSAAIRELAALVGVDYRPESGIRPPPNRYDAIPVTERAALAEVFADTSKLDPRGLGQSRLYTSPKIVNAILFLFCARAENQLPDRVDESWSWYPKLKEFIHGWRSSGFFGACRKNARGAGRTGA